MTDQPDHGLTDDDIKELQQIKDEHAERANDGGGFE